MKSRSLFAVALAATLVPVLAAAAPASAAKGSSRLSMWAGGFFGYETDDFDGLALRADIEGPLGALSPQVDLSWVGSLGYSRLSDEVPGNIDIDADILKFIPAARLSFPVNPQLTLFADAGLGFYYASVEDDDEFSLLMRFGGGGWLELNQTTRIGAAVEVDPYFGDFDQTTFIIQAGVMFRL